jgi:formylmethanofuran dehydrogenase subunit E
MEALKIVKKISVDLKIIGIVHSPYKTTKDVPLLCKKEISEIEIYKEFEQGLKDIEGFTHIHILYWLHKSTGYSLHVNTPWDDSLHGLFTSRSPYRPNPIGHITACY